MKTNFKFVFAIILFSTLILPGRIVAQDSIKVDTTNLSAYKPMKGSQIAKSKFGDINVRIYAYLRYLNQLSLDTSYTDSFGNTTPIDRRQDFQIQKVTVYFSGWFLDPKLKYLLYIWTNNASQGLGAQVVVAGNLSYNFNKHITLSGGILSLPGTRSTEGSFPFWLPVDNRMISDEFFRPSYTTGLQIKGEIINKLTYTAMLGNNLSQLGVDAGQLDQGINTFSGGLILCPTTGEYGLANSSFGDYELHQKPATRLAAHYTRSNEDRQGQPNTDAFENVQMRLSDGSVIFKPNLFSANTQVDNVRYQMTSIDGGVKYKGFALEGEYYRRIIDDFDVTGTPLTFTKLNDDGFQVLGSAMIVPKMVQLYSTYAKVFGEYGDPYEIRGGVNWFPWKTQLARFNVQYIYQNRSPVGNTSLPYTVGATGSMYNIDFEINF